MASQIVLPAGVQVPVANGWTQMPIPPNAGVLNEIGAAYFVHRPRSLVAIRSRELGRWHLSVSHHDRIPTWEEIGFARDSLIPADAWMMVPHPPRRFWMNLNRRVLHLWEFRDETLREQFEYEGELAQRGGFGTPDSGEARR